MTSLATTQMVEALDRYYADRMFARNLHDVRKRFLQKSDLETLSGRPYMVLCLLVAQAMADTMAGYSGSSASDSILHEAIGMAIACVGIDNPQIISSRYLSLYKQVFVLQTTHKEFADLLDSVLLLDMKAPEHE